MSVTTLESLKAYVLPQAARVEELSDEDCMGCVFRDTGREDWMKFWRSAWGGGEPNALDDKHRLDIKPLNPRDMNNPNTPRRRWNLNYDGIIAQSKYQETEDFALSNCGDGWVDAAVVITPPGIEKSIFLLRLLLRRLELCLPTALQVNSNEAILFCKEGVKEFTDLWGGADFIGLEPPPEEGHIGRIWALVDTDKEFYKPAPILQRGPFFVVEASSPRLGPYDWTIGNYVKYFKVDLRSSTEATKSHSHINLGSSKNILWDACRKYGLPLRHLSAHTNDWNSYEEDISNRLSRLFCEVPEK